MDDSPGSFRGRVLLLLRVDYHAEILKARDYLNSDLPDAFLAGSLIGVRDHAISAVPHPLHFIVPNVE